MSTTLIIMVDYECKKCKIKNSFERDTFFERPRCPNCGKKMRCTGYHAAEVEMTEERQKKLEEEWRKREASAKVTSVPCPYCHSMDTKKISGFSRAFSAEFFGLGSSKIGKQWHCNTCDSDF